MKNSQRLISVTSVLVSQGRLSGSMNFLLKSSDALYSPSVLRSELTETGCNIFERSSPEPEEHMELELKNFDGLNWSDMIERLQSRCQALCKEILITPPESAQTIELIASYLRSLLILAWAAHPELDEHGDSRATKIADVAMYFNGRPVGMALGIEERSHKFFDASSNDLQMVERVVDSKPLDESILIPRSCHAAGVEFDEANIYGKWKEYGLGKSVWEQVRNQFNEGTPLHAAVDQFLIYYELIESLSTVQCIDDPTVWMKLMKPDLPLPIRRFESNLVK